MTNHRVSLRQTLALRALLQRGHTLDKLTYDQYAGELTYISDTGDEFVITEDGDIQRWEEATVMQRRYVSDYREEGFLAGFREQP